MTDGELLPPAPADWSRWWWPGRWLSIVYGVWIDPLWYWRNVRPRIERQYWSLLIQGVLGSGIVAVGLALGLNCLLAAWGRSIDWMASVTGTLETAGPLALTGLLLGFGLSSSIWEKMTGAGTFVRRAARTIPPAVSFLVVSGVYPLVRCLAGLEGWRDSVEPFLFVGLLAAALGVATGIGLTVGNGAVGAMTYIAIIVTTVMVGFVMVPGGGTPAFTAGWMAAFAGILILAIFLSGRWAARQVRNAGERMRLANP